MLEKSQKKEKRMIEQILDLAAGLNINETFKGVKNKQLNGFAKCIIDLYKIPQKIVFKNVEEVFESPSNTWHTNEIQCKLYSNIEQWFLDKYGEKGEDKYAQACFNTAYNLFNQFTPKIVKKFLQSQLVPFQILYLFPIDITIFLSMFRSITSKKIPYDPQNPRKNLNDEDFQILGMNKEQVFDSIQKSKLKNDKCEIVIFSVEPIPCVSMPIGIAQTWFGSIQFLFNLKPYDYCLIKEYYYQEEGKLGVAFIATKNKGLTFLTPLLYNIKHIPKLQRNRRMVSKKRIAIRKMQNTAAEWINAHRKKLILRDEITGIHISKVTFYTMLALMALGCDTKTLRIGILGGLIHDIGKDAIPDEVLAKKGMFTILDRAIMDDHSLLGAALAIDACIGFQHASDVNEFKKGQHSLAQLLDGDEGQDVESIIEVVRLTIEHHEDARGFGLPFGSQPSDISLIGLIMQVADIYEAMNATRQYKTAMPHDEVLDFINEKLPSGTFDPKILQFFIDTVIPFIWKNFGENADTFLSEHHKKDIPLKKTILGILQGNIKTTDSELTKELNASIELKNWASTRYHTPKDKNVIQNMTIGTFNGHYEKLNVIGFLATFLKKAKQSFEKNNIEYNPNHHKQIVEEVYRLFPDIPKNIKMILDSINNRQRLMPFWYNSLKKDDWDWIASKISQENAIDQEYLELVQLTKTRYEKKAPYLQDAMNKKFIINF